jgi:predicted Fe-S protein YdhL (DUF1289 family)
VPAAAAARPGIDSVAAPAILRGATPPVPEDAMTDRFELVSPCVGECTLDDDGVFCRGCWRTIEEITAWPMLHEAGRLAVLRRLRERRRAAGQDRRRVTRRRRSADT